MKTLRTLYIITAAALLSSCIQEVQPEGQHVSGMWAIVNEQSQTTSYLKFEDGYMTTCTTVIPSDYKTVADGRMWHASENDFKPISTQRYSLSAENQLFLDGKHSGEMVLDGDSMTYGKQKAVAVTGFTSDYYSTVTTSVADDQIKADFLSQEMEFDYAVTNPVPNSRVQVIVSPGDMATVRLSNEGKMTVALPEVNASSVSSIILRYPGAKDLVISLVREASTAIDVEKTVWEYNYPACEVSIPFTLVNPAEGVSVAAELVSTSPWVKNVSVSSSMLTLSLDENNDSSNSYRGASIKLSAKGALDVYVGIRQFYTAPIVSYTPSGLSTDYKSKTGQSFSYVVNNTRSVGKVTVSCSSAWITNLEDNTGTVNFDVSENNSGATRYASIVTRYSFGNTYVSYYFSVSQSYSLTGITLTPTSQSTDYTAKSLSFTYAISNPRDGATASATTTDTWITDVKLSGNTVSYKVAENNSGSQRTGKIRLTYGTTYKDFSVTQSYTASTITCSPESQSTDYTAKSLSFTAAVANLREGCTLAASTTDTWITNVQLSGNTVSYKVAENNSGASRTGKIKLTYGSVSKEFSVTQTYTASVITCDPSSQSTDYTAKSLSFTATVSNLREGCTLAASTTDTWIANVQLSGNTVSYKVAENNSGASRTGKIKLTYGTTSKEFSVTQSYTAPVISFTPASQSTDYTAKSLLFTYSVDTPRQGVTASATTTDTWITNIQVSGTTVSYKVAENNSGASRTGKITLTYGSTNREFSVTQTYTAPVISFTPASQNTDYTAKSLSFTYSVDTPRQGVTASATTTDTWITNIQVSGTTVSYKVAENNSGASRTGKIKLTYAAVTAEFSITQMRLPIINGHEYVDLGLSVVWATCNVGASKPEDYGGYYQWAGTMDVKGNLDWSNCPYHTGSDQYTGWTKYVPSGRSSFWSGTGSPDNKTVLDPSDDVASVEWKGTWRMPTDPEWTELMNTSNCSWTWTTINGINGYKVQSKKSGYTDNWIFLPAAGFRFSIYRNYVGSLGGYWSSSQSTDYFPCYACGAHFGSNGVSMYYNDSRYYGRSVRAVSE